MIGDPIMCVFWSLFCNVALSVLSSFAERERERERERWWLNFHCFLVCDCVISVHTHFLGLAH